MSRKKSDISEADLAANLVEWLRAQHWEVYQEVEINGRIADIVAVMGRVVHIIECKLHFNIDVLYQAVKWREYANFVSICTPCHNWRHEDKFAVFMKPFGIGHLSYGSVYYNEICVSKKPDFRRAAIDVRKHLKEEHKNYAAAGSPTGRRWTPFKETCRNVIAAVQSDPGICLKDLIGKVGHHYSSDSGARACISHWIKAGKIAGVTYKQEGRYFRCYPVYADIKS